MQIWIDTYFFNVQLVEHGRKIVEEIKKTVGRLERKKGEETSLALTIDDILLDISNRKRSSKLGQC